MHCLWIPHPRVLRKLIDAFWQLVVGKRKHTGPLTGGAWRRCWLIRYSDIEVSD
ncbi:MAG: hypothetical protein ACI82A_004355 [Candidatus Azotimanducaceae bacterium]|jgi:hypothetical protein